MNSRKTRKNPSTKNKSINKEINRVCRSKEIFMLVYPLLMIYLPPNLCFFLSSQKLFHYHIFECRFTHYLLDLRIADIALCCQGYRKWGAESAPPLWKKLCHKHAYKLEFQKNEKRKWQTCFPNAAKFRQKPFLQASGVPACALLFALWCIVNNVGISSIKTDKVSQGCRTVGPE